jgi:hypothetical protein
MTIYHLLIKGDRFQAARAAADRGIPAAFVREQINRSETIVRTSGDYMKIATWFNEAAPHRGPFPVGTLIYFNQDRR